MNVLVTGGAGFIGSAVVRYIIEETLDSVLVVDCLTYAGNIESLENVQDNPRYSFAQIDICDSSALNNVFTSFKPDAVMHLAAESHVDRSIDGPAAFIDTNIMGTYVLLEAARSYWNSLDVNKKKISASIIFLLMKFMVTCMELTTYLLKRQPMHQVAHIQLRKQQVII